jgi:uncharacterized protein (TIGR03437 family)
MRRSIVTLLLCAATVLPAADFQDFQAARAVIGQPSFSAHEKGAIAHSLSLVKGNLYVADASGRVLTYDVSRIGNAKTPGCPVCLPVPQATIGQNVFGDVAAFAVYGRKIAIADTKNHRVLLWTGTSSGKQPDVTLSGFRNPVSVALDSERLFVGDAATHHVFIWNSFPIENSQPPDVTLGSDLDGPGADTIQSPTALVSDGANLYVADAAARRVMVFSPAIASMPQIVNAASLESGPFAPGTLVEISPAAGTAVLLNGAPVPVTETDGDKLQVQIPYDLNNATAASLWVKSENGTSVPVPLRFTSASPGIFAFGATDPRTGMVLHAPAGIPLSPEDPAKPSELLSVWATGLGAVSPSPNSDGSFDVLTPVRATLNGNLVEVVSAVLPAAATGIYEVRLRLPSRLPGSASLVVSQNDVESNLVTFPLAASHR